MVGCTSHIHRAAGLHGAKPCGRHPKTSLPEVGSSGKKSPGVSSNDWRRKAAAMSSPRRDAKRSDQSYNADDNIDIQLNYEHDTSFSGPQYRYPTTKRARWESVLSAPTWQEPSSSSSISEDDLREVTRVQLKHVNPIFTTINGEDVPLPNRFTLEVAVVRPDDNSPGPALAELKPTNGRAILRAISSDNSDHILVELQNMIKSDRVTRNSATSASSEAHDAHLCTQHARTQGRHECSSNSVTTNGRSFATSEPSDAQTEPPSEEEARFHRMLSRLQKSRQESPPAQETVRAAALPPRRPADPAIMASKVASKTEASETSTRDGLNKEAANQFFAQQLDDMRNPGQQSSTDSGYASKDNERSSSGDSSEPESRTGDQHGRSGSSPDDGQLKALNPAAAEFKATTNNESTPWFAPKKLARQPITNIFPNAMAPHLPLSNAAAPEGGVPQQVPRAGVSAALPAQTANDNTLGRSPWSTSQPMMTPAELRGGNTLSSQAAAPPMGLGSIMAPAMSTGSPLFASLASAGASLNTPVSGPPMGMPVLNGFNTFPPAPGTHMPLFNPGGAVPGLNPCLAAAPTPFNPAAPLAPQSMLVPGGGKPARPYFPVTTKPRDRDPVKQQMYEAYLEWRKANEPGYHMKCKIRQAQRVVRQHQQQQGHHHQPHHHHPHAHHQQQQQHGQQGGKQPPTRDPVA